MDRRRSGWEEKAGRETENKTSRDRNTETDRLKTRHLEIEIQR